MKKITIIVLAVLAIVVTSFSLLSAKKITSTNGDIVKSENNSKNSMEPFAMEDSNSF
jgi:uncharacterized protein YxeA